MTATLIGVEMLDGIKRKGFEVKFLSHATAILKEDFPEALTNLEAVLLDFYVPISEIIGSGGGETQGTQRLRHGLAHLGWNKVNFEIKKTINGQERESISHEVDHVKQFDNGVVALEIEWNNKDPFFDRDLENYKRLHAEGAISVGIIITRGSSLQDGLKDLVYRYSQEEGICDPSDLTRIGLAPTRRQEEFIRTKTTRERDPVSFGQAWTDIFVSDKFGAATTHWRKLMDRVDRGVGNPCPLVLIGLPASIVSFERSEGI